MRSPRGSAGLTLIELMVSLAIGSALMLAGATLFLNSRHSYVQDEQAAYVQEVGRYSLRFLSRELGMSGFFGGVQQPDLIEVEQTLLNGAELTPNSSCYHLLLNVDSGLTHYNNVNSAGAETDARGSVTGRSVPNDCFGESVSLLAGSDVLVVRRVKDSLTVSQGSELQAIEPAATYLSVLRYNERFALFTGAGADLSTDDEGADIWRATDLWEYSPQLLFVRVQNEGICADGVTETLELCRLRLNQSGSGLAPIQCLVEGVERIDVIYGLDLDGDQTIDSYTSVPSEDDMSRAVSARVSVLARSDQTDARYSDDKTYTLGENTFTPGADENSCNDRIRRSVFGSTVMLRNMEALGI